MSALDLKGPGFLEPVGSHETNPFADEFPGLLEPSIESPDYEYIVFEMTAQSKSKKTEVWNCRNRQSGVVLGVVKWYTGWRGYCYFPIAEDAIYSAGCLVDISDFIARLMRERRRKAKDEKA